MKKPIIILFYLALMLSACTWNNQHELLEKNKTNDNEVVIQEEALPGSSEKDEYETPDVLEGGLMPGIEEEEPDDYEFYGTLGEFKDRFNSTSMSIALQILINGFTINENKFKAILEDQIFKGTEIYGELDGYNKVKRVVLVCEKCEEKNEMLRFGLLMDNVINALTPEVYAVKKDTFVYELGIPEDYVSLKDGIKTLMKYNHTYNLKITGQKLDFTVSKNKEI